MNRVSQGGQIWWFVRPQKWAFVTTSDSAVLTDTQTVMRKAARSVFNEILTVPQSQILWMLIRDSRYPEQVCLTTVLPTCQLGNLKWPSVSWLRFLQYPLTGHAETSPAYTPGPMLAEQPGSFYNQYLHDLVKIKQDGKQNPQSMSLFCYRVPPSAKDSK